MLAFAAIVAAQMLDHGSITALFNASAFVLIIFGTIGASLTATSLDEMKLLPRRFKEALSPPVLDFDGSIHTLTEFARKARVGGLLKLEEETGNVSEDYLKRGLENAISGMDPETIDDQMSAERESLYISDLSSSRFFEAAGGFSPTMGIIGTVIGLISVLSNISNVAKLAGSIATAFTATLLGITLANVIWLPIGMRLKQIAHDRRMLREIQATAVIAIARGDSSRQLERALSSMMAGRKQMGTPPPSKRGRTSGSTPSAAEDPGANVTSPPQEA